MNILCCDDGVCHGNGCGLGDGCYCGSGGGEGAGEGEMVLGGMRSGRHLYRDNIYPNMLLYPYTNYPTLYSIIIIELQIEGSHE